MSQRVVSVEEARELARQTSGRRRRKPADFALASAEKPAKKYKTTNEWLAHFRATPPRPATVADQVAQRALFERHDAAVMRLWLPLPPSKNRLHQLIDRPGMRPFLAPTNEAKAYVTACNEAWIAHWKGWPPEPLTGRLRVLMTVYTRQAGGDVANREEALCDALTACQAWLDDGQIDDLRVLRGGVLRPTGGLDLIIETIEEAA